MDDYPMYGMPEPEQMSDFGRKLRREMRKQIHRYGDHMQDMYQKYVKHTGTAADKDLRQWAGEGLCRAYLHTGLAYGVSEQLGRLAQYYFGDYVKGLDNTKKLQDYIKEHDLENRAFEGSLPEEVLYLCDLYKPLSSELAQALCQTSDMTYASVAMQATFDLSVDEDGMPQGEMLRNAADGREKAMQALMEKGEKRYAPPAKMMPARGKKSK